MTDSPRVLYVDDNSNSLEVRAMMLGEYDIDVVTETNVGDARRRLAEGDIDCVLSDLDMPDEDGFDLLEHVQDEHPALPFILFTSHESEAVIEKALDSGATDYFPKSLTNVSYRLLAHRIEQAIRIVEAEQAAAISETQTDEGGMRHVPRTEIEPANEKRRAEVEDWGWEQSGGDTEPATKTAAPAELEDIEKGPHVVVSEEIVNEPEPEPELTADEPEWEITSETEDALQWLDSDERRTETAGIESEREDAETGPEPDGFVYPAERKEAKARSRSPDEGDSAEETQGEGTDVVGPLQGGADSEGEEATATSEESVATAGTEGSKPTKVEQAEASPIPGVAPSAEAGASEPVAAPDKRDEPDGTSRAAAGGSRADSEEGLAANVNLGSDTASDVSPASEEPAEAERLEETPAGAQPIPSVALETDSEMDSTLDTGSEPASETGSEPEPEPSAHEHTHDHALLEGFDPQPGEGVLVECGAQDSRKGHACLDLLGLDSVEGRNVLLIRYRQIGSERLRRIAEDAEDVHLISIGYRQSVPDDIGDLVETTRINNPSELTRLGIVMTRVIGDWDDSVETVVCLDSLDILMGYKDERSVFRFLHVLLSKLQSADAVSHFHIEPRRGDNQGADTLKPLFDSIVSIDDDGVHIE